MRPDRIVVGELRDGAAALETLKAWNTGHPGGVTTVHANSAGETLSRLEDLLLEVTLRPPRRLIAQGIDLIAHIQRSASGRRVQALLAVSGGDSRGGLRLRDVDEGRELPSPRAQGEDFRASEMRESP
jgi:type IV secretion system protein VirB11